MNLVNSASKKQIFNPVCSLPCSQAHRNSCSTTSIKTSQDQPPTLDGSSVATAQQNTLASSEDQKNIAASETHRPPGLPPQNSLNDFSTLEHSPKLQELWTRFPTLRSKLLEVYKLTLEEEWIETGPPTYGRGRGRGRGNHSRMHGRSRGPWTPGKGFNRGVGKVRKWRESCEANGPSIGNTNWANKEAFRQFIALVNPEEAG
ncbi:hypothetical protein FQN57_005365 [Myotisia sp. PD_48]|nr:hypothetical protein FQN57_005365 [Myotisia sp. PD_48]